LPKIFLNFDITKKIMIPSDIKKDLMLCSHSNTEKYTLGSNSNRLPHQICNKHVRMVESESFRQNH